jgi:hypothetical protein
MVNIAQIQEFVPVGGASVFRRLATASTNGLNVKASAGRVYGWYVFNTSIAAKYLKLYNLSIAPSPGTDTPLMTIPIPPGSGSNVWFAGGISFPVGIGIGITGFVSDNDTTVVSTNDVILNLLYA